MRKRNIKSPRGRNIRPPRVSRVRSRRLRIGNSELVESVEATTTERSMHMHVIGSTGKGKSNFLEHCIRQDIKNGRGLCLIDPHGGLYDKIVEWCAYYGMDGMRRIRLIEPGNTEWITSYNPLKVPVGTDVSVIVESLADAFARVWGGADILQTPTLKRVLEAIFERLASTEQTLVEAIHFYDLSDESGHQEYLKSDIEDEVASAIWKNLDYTAKHAKREYSSEFISTINRISAFIKPPAIRRMFAIGEKNLDMRACMDNGDIVLVNLSPNNQFSPTAKRLLGALLVNECFQQASQREKPKKPFYLYIDECHELLTGDIANILDGSRKFGLHTILSHQRLGQLREAGDDIFNAVMGCTQNKVVLGGLGREDAEYMAGEIAQLDLEKPVEALIRPTVVGHELRVLKGGSKTEGESHSISEINSEARSVFESEGTGEFDTEGMATAITINDEGETVVSTDTESGALGVASSHSSGTSHVTGHSTAYTSGSSSSSSSSWTETLVPVYKNLPTAIYSLEALKHGAGTQLKFLRVGRVAVSIAGSPGVFATVPHMKNIPVTPEQVSEFKYSVNANDKYSLSVRTAEHIITERRKQLEQKVIEHQFADEFEVFSEDIPDMVGTKDDKDLDNL